MHLSVSSQFTLKNRPPDHKGIIGDRITIGKNRPSSLAEMCMALMEHVFDYYCIVDKAEGLNAELKLVIAWLNGIHFTHAEAPIGQCKEGEK